MGQDKTSKTHPPPNHLFEVGKIYIRQSRRDGEFRHPLYENKKHIIYVQCIKQLYRPCL